MALIRVFGNTYINPYWVGKVTLEVLFTDITRKNTTTVFDCTGNNVLVTFETTISRESDNPDKNAAERDNFFHSEVLRSINQGEDARAFVELDVSNLTGENDAAI